MKKIINSCHRSKTVLEMTNTTINNMPESNPGVSITSLHSCKTHYIYVTFNKHLLERC